MALSEQTRGRWIDEDPFQGLCDLCGEPIFRAGGWAWTHEEGWRDDDHQPIER